MWDVAVVGAGCAGLAAATRLSEDGSKVVVIERRGILGGRTSSFRDARTGEVMDNGQHLFLGAYEETIAYLRRVGSSSLLLFDTSSPTWMIGPDGKRACLRSLPLPAPFHMGVGVLGFGALSLRERLGVIRVARAAAGEPVLSENLSAADWLEGLRQGARTMERLWTPLILATLNRRPAQAQARLFVEVLRRGVLTSRRASAVGLSSVGLSDLHAEPAASFITSRGGQVRRNALAERLLFKGGLFRGVVLGDTSVEEAGSLVLAVPPPALLRLVEGTPLWEAVRPIHRLVPSPIVSVHAFVNEPPFEEKFVGFWGNDIHWAFRRDRIVPTSSGPGADLLQVTCLASAAETLIGKSRRQLKASAEAALSLASGGKHISAARVVIVKEAEATWSPPLAHEQGRLTSCTPVANVFLSGDWTDTGLPATVEGAVKSGHAAAASILWAGSCR